MAKPYKRPPRGNSDKFLVRLPPGMRERIAVVAKRNGRTLTAEIVDVLDREFPPAPSIEELFEQVDFLISMYKEGVDQDITRRELSQALDVLAIKFDQLKNEPEE